MMRLPRPVNMTLNLAPMVDVMMCLIIFFLLAAKMVAAEQHPVDLPWAVAAREVEAADLGTRVTISVRRADATDARAEYVVADWDGQQVVERVLGAADVDALLARRAEHATEKLCCVIRADQNVRYEHVEVVLRACGLAKISDVVFAARAGAEPEPNP
jgi:biopolymer transport protein ExbD